MSDTKRLLVIIGVALWCLISLPFAHAQQCIDEETIQLAGNVIIQKKLGSSNRVTGAVGGFGGPEAVAGGGGCSGTYGNTGTTNNGLGDGSSSECNVIRITGACDGNTASLGGHLGYYDPAASGNRYRFVIYSDNAGSPGSLLGSVEGDDTNGGGFGDAETNIVVDTNSTTFWIGVCKEASANWTYTATSGGTTRTVYNCASAYSSPPATWGTGCTNDGDYDTRTMQYYVKY